MLTALRGRAAFLAARWCVAVLIASATLAPGRWLPAGETYRDSQALDDAVRRLAAGVPWLVRLSEIGRTSAGHPIHLLTLGAGDLPAVGDRPALLIVAGLDGTHLHGPAVALELARRLAVAHHDGHETIEPFLDSHTLYVIPRVNVDGQHRYFARPRMEHRGTVRPRDDDRDGKTDEDGPEDLDGDGVIATMRVEDPEGEWLAVEEDARLLRKADPEKGEVGRFKLYTEGLDNDGDGEINEDGIEGVVLDRNFPQDYLEFTGGAGPHAVSEPESRALADFVVSHPDLALCLVYGPHDSLSGDVPVEEPRKGGPPVGTLESRDRHVVETLRERFQEITGFESAVSSGLRANGAFYHWVYSQRGFWSLSTSLWTGPRANPEPPRDGDAPAKDGGPKTETAERAQGPGGETTDSSSQERSYPETDEGRWLRYSDEEREGSGFLDWKPFEHPTLGRVEIGGWVPYFRTTPPPGVVEDFVATQMEFLVDLMGRFPRLAFEGLRVRELGGGLFEISARIVNHGFLPTSSARAAITRQVRPLLVEIDLEPATIVRDEPRSPPVLLSGESRSLERGIPGGGGHRSFRWVLRGRRGDRVLLRAMSPAAGRADMEVILESTEEIDR